MNDQKWISEALKICGYHIKDITYLGHEEIAESVEQLYLSRVFFSGEIVERIVYKHGQCLDMISKNLQVIDMFGKDDTLIFPNINGEKAQLAERYPIMENKISADTVLFYKDYVSLREHFFSGRQCIQLVSWIRNDASKNSIDFGKYGRYVMTSIARE